MLPPEGKNWVLLCVCVKKKWEEVRCHTPGDGGLRKLAPVGSLISVSETGRECGGPSLEPVCARLGSDPALRFVLEPCTSSRTQSGPLLCYGDLVLQSTEWTVVLYGQRAQHAVVTEAHRVGGETCPRPHGQLGAESTQEFLNPIQGMEHTVAGPERPLLASSSPPPPPCQEETKAL